MLVSDEQFLQKSPGIDLTALLITIPSRLEQSWKHFVPNDVIFSVLTVLSDVQPSNALSGSDVIYDGNVIDVIALQPLNAFALRDFTFAVSNPKSVSTLHHANASEPTVVTLFVKSILVRAEQDDKALLPIVVTFDAPVMVVSVVHLLNALSPIVVTVLGRVIDVNVSALHS